jgi:glycosyltransferase involved in cell wall biosynthesis
MKIAIVHDDLMRRGGGEQVALTLLRAFPNADFYTLCYRPRLTYEEFKNYKINTSLFQYFVRSERQMKWLFFPLGLLCMKLMKLKNYDLVIISTTFCGKYIRYSKGSQVFLYIHTPFRLLWDPTSYKEYNKSKGLVRYLFDLLLKQLRHFDKKEAKRATFHLCNSKETEKKIIKAYSIRNLTIINPPVKCNNFYVNESENKEYYLIVSRLEFYKKVDLAIEAFNQLGYPLIVVGNGSKKAELISMAKKNIKFKSDLSSDELKELYANCKALIFPQHEDYGITPLEANASGRPVIAYAKGGVLETMIPYKGIPGEFSSVFFYEQNIESLMNAIKQFEQLKVDSNFIREHALKYDEPVFIQKLQQFVHSSIK